MSGYRQNLLHLGYSLNPVTGADGEVLLSIFATTRGVMQVLSHTPEWSAVERLDFVRTQSHFQEKAYRGPGYEGAFLDLVRHEGRVLGRLYLLHQPGVQLRLMDITLLPEFRSQGHGTTLIRAIQADAGRLETPVIAMVEDDNPACTLYTRLGFVPTNHTFSFYRTWQWSPQSQKY
ncbi:MAG TPA: GNAT family N-acetyltransferase [Magnetococcales bacterium]|nr:GNAT family N-acetyltransferase [Magnetococcales bacterium]